MIQENLIPIMPPDPLFLLQEEFQKSPISDKINLGIGAYKNDQGLPYVFPCVKEAERRIMEKQTNKEYLPILGHEDFLQQFKSFIFAGNEENICLNQSVGGTGALAVIAHTLKNCGVSTIHLSDPTWVNHHNIFSMAGIQTASYPYYSPEKQGLHLDKTLDYLSCASGAVLLQPSCHNPSGFDPSQEDWKTLLQLVNDKKLTLVFDLAYHGFKESLDTTPYPISYALEKKIPFFLAYSFSKNMGLYGERLGVVVCYHPNKPVGEKLQNLSKKIVRSLYSNPPKHSALIAFEILSDSKLRQSWINEMKEVKKRVDTMRHALSEGLKEKRGYHFLKEQSGMFSLLPITKQEVEKLKTSKGIFMPSSGRINVAGLTPNNLSQVIEALETL